MNFGECPYECGETLLLYLPVYLPVFAKIECENCKGVIWYKLSRLDPCAYTEADFREAFKVNEETKEIKPLSKPFEIDGFREGGN